MRCDNWVGLKSTIPPDAEKKGSWPKTEAVFARYELLATQCDTKQVAIKTQMLQGLARPERKKRAVRQAR